MTAYKFRSVENFSVNTFSDHDPAVLCNAWIQWNIVCRSSRVWSMNKLIFPRDFDIQQIWIVGISHPCYTRYVGVLLRDFRKLTYSPLNVSIFSKLDIWANDSEMKVFMLKAVWAASYNVITDKSSCRPVEKMGWWSEGHETVKKWSQNRTLKSERNLWLVTKCEEKENMCVCDIKCRENYISVASGDNSSWKVMCLGGCCPSLELFQYSVFRLLKRQIWIWKRCLVSPQLEKKLVKRLWKSLIDPRLWVLTILR